MLVIDLYPLLNGAFPRYPQFLDIVLMNAFAECRQIKLLALRIKAQDAKYFL